MKGFVGLTDYVLKMNEQADDAIRRLSWDAFKTLLRRSPVKIGNFRANWLVSVNVAKVGDPDNYGRKPGTGGTFQSERVSNPGVNFGGKPTGLEMTNARPLWGAKIGDTVYITNNLRYAKKLENGRSRTMAPNGVLYVSAQEVHSLWNSR